MYNLNNNRYADGKQNEGVYEVGDWRTSPDDDSVVICSWLISANATQLAGSLNFLLRFACVSDDSTIDYAWHTEIYSGISISNGMNNGEAVVTQYADVLEQWKRELEEAAGGVSEEQIAAAVENYFAENPVNGGVVSEEQVQEAINTALAQAKESGDFDGVGIASITQTASNADGGTNTIEVVLTDGKKYTFTVKNGNAGTPGKNGDDGTSVTVSSVTESTEDGGSNVVTFSDGTKLTVKNGKTGAPGKSAYAYAQDGGYTGTEAEFAQKLAQEYPTMEEFDSLSGEIAGLETDISDETTARENAIADLKAQGVQQTPAYPEGETVEEQLAWLAESGDTSKVYLMADGYIYAWMSKTVNIIHNANDGTGVLNQRPQSSGNMDSLTASNANGIFTIPPIRVDNSWATCIVNMSGITSLSTVLYRPIWVFYYDADGNIVGDCGLNGFGDSSATVSLPYSLDIAAGAKNGVKLWPSTTYVRMYFGIDGDKQAISVGDIDNFVVNFERLDSVEASYGWHSTGHMFNTDDYGHAIEQNAADVEVLKTDVANLKEAVKTTPSQSGAVWYAVGDSITKGYGVGAENCWVKYVMQYNGYDSEKSLNLGVSGIGFAKTDPNYSKTARTVVDENDFSEVDLVTIAIGINDWKEPFSMDTVTSEMGYCFTKILTDNPYCKIIFIAPFNTAKYGTVDTNWAMGYSGSDVAGGTLRQFIDAQITVCKEYSVQVVDLSDSGVINRYNIQTVLYDNLHPNAECHTALGKELSRRITFA